MDFFDRLTSKTKELTDSARLTFKLADEKRKLPELYERLGQFVFTRYEMGEATDEAYTQIINNILSVKENIRAISDEIDGIRSYVEKKSVCPMCGAVNTNATVCTVCGSDIPSDAECESDCGCCEDDDKSEE